MAKITLSMNSELLKLVDDFCSKFSYERSEFIRNCIRGEIFSQTLQSVGVNSEDINPITAELFKMSIKKKKLTSKVAKEIMKNKELELRPHELNK